MPSLDDVHLVVFFGQDVTDCVLYDGLSLAFGEDFRGVGLFGFVYGCRELDLEVLLVLDSCACS